MQNPDLRNLYFLASNVENAGMDMAKKLPPVDERGNYVLEKNAGKRRIDYLLYKESDGAVSRKGRSQYILWKLSSDELEEAKKLEYIFDCLKYRLYPFDL